MRRLFQEPMYAQRLGQIYDMPTSQSGYGYGRALANQQAMLRNLAQQRTQSQALGQVDADLAKDAARRQYLANRFATDQALENLRGRNVGAFANLLTQAVGTATAPIRPGGEKHGDFMAALEVAGEKMKNRQNFINQFSQEQGRLPGMADFKAFQDNPNYLG